MSSYRASGGVACCGAPYQTLRGVGLRGCFHSNGLRESPFPVQNLGVRTIETHRIVPTRHDWQAIGNLTVTTAELNRDRPIRILLRRDVVNYVRVCGVFHEVTLC